MSQAFREAIRNEEGHVAPLAGVLLGMVGFILLGIGAANGTGWLCVTGGILGAVGLLGWELIRHTKIDYGVFRAIDDLNAKK